MSKNKNQKQREKKSWLSNRKFRSVQARLDSIGICTDIVKKEKSFCLIRNFEIIKVAARRETIRRYIVNLHNINFPSLIIPIRKYGKNKQTE